MSFDNSNLPTFDGSVKSRKEEKRCRNWSFIVYPDSAPDNWMLWLDEQHVQCIISPLHDRDINADGEPKKPHYHVLLLFDGNKSYQQILDDFCVPLHATIPQKVNNLKAYARYLIHADNPEKAQYLMDDIITYGGLVYEDYYQKSTGAEMQVLHDIFAFILDNRITEFNQFCMIAFDKNDEWFYFATCKYTLAITRFIQSYRHERKELTDSIKNALFVNTEGEV